MARRPRPDLAAAGGGTRWSPAQIVDVWRATFPPVHPSGLPFIAAGLAVAGAGRRRGGIRRAGLLTAVLSAGFFRQPRRVAPMRTGVVLAPADGVICAVDTAPRPAELEASDSPLPRISIFMSVFDAHVQRAPVGGDVVCVRYRRGGFVAANLGEASEHNERNSVVIRTATGVEVTAVQVAGLLARRIVCDVRAGDHLNPGEVYGIIRFGSRLDTYLPAGSNPVIRVGQRTVAGETVLAELPGM